MPFNRGFLSMIFQAASILMRRERLCRGGGDNRTWSACLGTVGGPVMDCDGLLQWAQALAPLRTEQKTFPSSASWGDLDPLRVFMQDPQVPGGSHVSPLNQLWALTTTEGKVGRKDSITYSEHAPNTLPAFFQHSPATGELTSVNLSSFFLNLFLCSPYTKY